MIINPSALTQSRKRRSGFSLVETSISTLLVGLLLVVATSSLGSSVRTQSIASNMVKASSLADSLMSEILTCSYMEPGATSSVITREAGESGGSKVNYDDVDDFANWEEQPPQYRDGSNMSNLANWKRRVTIHWVTIGGGAVAISNAETKIKRITIDVSLNNTIVVTRQALATQLN